jgi:hypothetical protein
LDLERFTRALRLRWLWFKWKRVWNNLKIPCDKYDHDLFNASTVVNVGDGKASAFWTSPLIEGNTAKNIAPSLYKKKHVEKQSQSNNKWFDHIYPPSTREEVIDFVRPSGTPSWRRMELNGDGQKVEDTLKKCLLHTIRRLI